MILAHLFEQFKPFCEFLTLNIRRIVRINSNISKTIIWTPGARHSHEMNRVVVVLCAIKPRSNPSNIGIIKPMLPPSMPKRLLLVLVASIVPGLLISCGASSTPTSTAIPPTQIQPPPTPSPTEPPLAARVNGEGIWLAEYQSELQRLQSASTETNTSLTSEEQRQKVLDELINSTLLAQAAVKNGYNVDDQAVQARLAELTNQAGGADKVSEWEAKYFYTEDTLHMALRRSMLAVLQRNQIINAVPQTADQVHARQILVTDEAAANQIYQNLQAGADFQEQAQIVDPLTGGDLGWFPRGYLFQPDVEAAAFSLQPEQFSPIIKTSYGFHIIEVVERDNQHPLSPDARLALQRQALMTWLQDQRKNSQIDILVQ